MRGYGPVTLDQLGRWWNGNGARQGRRMLPELADEVIEVDVDGTPAWLLAADLPELLRATPPNAARLLPAFDPWVAGGPRDVPTLLPPDRHAEVYRPQGWLSPVILVNGQIAGIWKHTRKGQRLLIDLTPFAPLPAWACDQIEAEALRLASFLDTTPSIEWTTGNG
jgi:hypothetical protein